MLLCLTLPIAALICFLMWRIMAKAGYNGALGLLVLVPIVGQLILLCILAFDQWPIHRQPAVGTVPPYAPPSQWHPQASPYQPSPMYQQPSPGYQQAPMYQQQSPGYQQYEQPQSGYQPPPHYNID